MKYIQLLAIIALCGFCYNIHAQNGFKATYELTYQPDSTNTKSKQSERFLLYMDQEMSQFLSYNNAVRDSLFLDIEKGNLSMEEITQRTMNNPRTKFHFKVNKIYNESIIEVLQELLTNLYKYEQSLNLMDWTITNETSKINGYDCQKATTTFAGREYVAWYDAEIAISEGPYKFYGLPGLIISVYDTKEHYRFDLVGLEKGSFQIKRILLNEDYQTINEAEYKKILANYEANAAATAKRIFSNMEGQAKPKKNYKNNPIELE